MYQQWGGWKVGFGKLKKHRGIKKGATLCSNLCKVETDLRNCNSALADARRKRDYYKSELKKLREFIAAKFAAETGENAPAWYDWTNDDLGDDDWWNLLHITVVWSSAATIRVLSGGFIRLTLIHVVLENYSTCRMNSAAIVRGNVTCMIVTGKWLLV